MKSSIFFLAITLLTSCLFAQEFNNFTLEAGNTIQKDGTGISTVNFIGKKDDYIYTYYITRDEPFINFYFRKHDLKGNLISQAKYTVKGKKYLIENLDILLLEDKMLVTFQQKKTTILPDKKEVSNILAVEYAKMKIIEVNETLESLFPELPSNETIAYATLNQNRSKIVIFTENPNSSTLDFNVHAYDLSQKKLWTQKIKADIPRNKVVFDKVLFENNGNVLIRLNSCSLLNNEPQISKANCTDLLFSIVNNGESSFQNDLTFDVTRYICDYEVKTDKAGNIVCIGFFRSEVFLKNSSDLGAFPSTEAEGIWYRKFDQKNGEIMEDKTLPINENNFDVGFTEAEWTKINTAIAKNKWPGIDMKSFDLLFDENNNAYFVSRFNPKSYKIEKFLQIMDVVVFKFSSSGDLEWSKKVYNRSENNYINHSIFNFVMTEKGLHVIAPVWLKKYPIKSERSLYNAFVISTISAEGDIEYEIALKYHRYKPGFEIGKALLVDEQFLYLFKHDRKANTYCLYRMGIK